MSEQRIPDVAFSRKIARENGKIKTVPAKSTRFEFYNAGQFSTRLDGRNFTRSLPARKSKRREFYLTMFRLRIDGKWYRPGGNKYEFFTMDEALKVLREA